MKPLLMITPVLVLFAAAGCGGDNPAQPADPGIVFGFEDGLQGWSPGTTGNGWGNATWSDRGDGMIHLDGVGGPGDPNSWVSRGVALPSDAAQVTYRISGHDRRNGDSAFRLRIEDTGVSTTVHDWQVIVGGTDGNFNWLSFSDDISAFAGKTVNVYFEQDDDGDGTDEHIYLDSISFE
jgi:hypothetical protein